MGESYSLSNVGISILWIECKGLLTGLKSLLIAFEISECKSFPRTVSCIPGIDLKCPLIDDQSFFIALELGEDFSLTKVSCNEGSIELNSSLVHGERLIVALEITKDITFIIGGLSVFGINFHRMVIGY